MSRSYEEVLTARRERYGHFDDRTAWWEVYLADEGWTCRYLPVTALLATVSQVSGDVGHLVMHHHRTSASHIVAIDEAGYVDPSDGFPEHVPFDRYPRIKASQGFVFDEDFLAIARLAGSLTREPDPEPL